MKVLSIVMTVLINCYLNILIQEDFILSIESIIFKVLLNVIHCKIINQIRNNKVL